MSIKFHWPEMKLPIFMIVDDPAPCLNLAHYEQYWEPHRRDVPNSFTAGWADLIEEFGVRGKFSVLPIPAGIGRIDRPLPDVQPADQQEFLRIAADRISPQMDIGIEFLTHFLAWNVKRERPEDFTEKTMGPFTNPGHLTEYFAHGLQILSDVGLNPTGATSPGASCRDVEWIYQGAIRNAVRSVTGRKVAWYFLHVDDHSPVVLPRIASLDSSGEACVSMVSAGNDPCWQTQWEDPSRLEILISEDGQSGRLAELYRNESVISFHTHWQSLFSEGRSTGLKDFRTLFSRIREHLGDGARWIKCSELAETVVAQALVKTTTDEREGARTVTLSSPVSAACFTFSLPARGGQRLVSIGGRELKRLQDGASTLVPDSWSLTSHGITVCTDLPAGELSLRLQ